MTKTGRESIGVWLGGSIVSKREHAGTNIADTECTTRIVQKYRQESCQ